LLRARRGRVAAGQVADGTGLHAAGGQDAGEAAGQRARFAEAVVGGLFVGEARVDVFVVGFGVGAFVPC
jgi:hypothetical protein